MAGSLLDALRAVLPDMRLLTETSATEAYRFDETEYTRPGVPLAVCFPRSAVEVATIVRLCAEHRVPLVPRGAGSGLSGGAIATDGALTVVMTGMDRILEIDRANLVAVVQPGIINAQLGRAVAEVGLFYAPDPASFEMCTIGGNLAENSGGLRCVKYGVTRDFVLGLEVVLADGEVIRTGGKNVKDVAGYDLTGLFVGSEGTLGLITEATLRLLPIPPAKLTMIAFFTTVRAAGEARAAEGAAATAAGAPPVTRPTDPQEADGLPQARRAAHGSLEKRGAARMDDVGVPRSRIPEMLEHIERIAAAHELPVGVFGHAGDGNLHPTYIVDRNDPTAEARIDAARDEIYRAAL